MSDLPSLIKSIGYLGIFVIIFSESGLLIGFFLPGDSLLFTAGLLASQGFLSVWLTAVIVFIGAVAGDNFGYAFGRKVGPLIFKKEDSFFFHKNHLSRAKSFYEKHGPKAIVFARFLPGIRTLAPILAGVGEMSYRKFFSYNVIGAFCWGIGLTLLGYYLGSLVPGVDEYLIPIILAIVSLSFLPSAVHFFRYRKNH